MIDLHTHSISSGHAINTINELILYSKAKGITHLGITDHGPSMKGAPHEDYFWVSDKLPNEVEGVKVFMGVEANILNPKGKLDLSEEILKKQKIVSAGLHKLTPYSGKTIEDNTSAIVSTIVSKKCNIIVHPIRKDFPIHVEPVVEAALKYNVLLELNNQVFSYVSKELLNQYKKMVGLLKKENHYVVLGSDSHSHFTLGDMNEILKYKKKLNLVDEMILNNYPKLVGGFLRHE